MSSVFKRRFLGIPVLVALTASLAACGFSGTKSTQEAYAYLEDLEYDEALASFDLAEEAHEDGRMISRGRGIVFLDEARYSDAVSAFLSCLTASDGIWNDMDIDVNYYLAEAYTSMGEYESAIAVYDAILALRPAEADALFLRGSARLLMGDTVGAEADYEATIALSPSDYDRLMDIYFHLSRAGCKSLGTELLERALADDDASTSRSGRMSSFDRGRIYYCLEQYTEAQSRLEEAKSGKDPEAFVWLGRAYEATGDYNYAITNVYTIYIDRYDPSPEVYNQLGLCYLKVEKYDLALDAFTQGLKLADQMTVDPQTLQALHFNEITAREYTGDFANAKMLMEAYVKAYPDDERADREMRFLGTR